MSLFHNDGPIHIVLTREGGKKTKSHNFNKMHYCAIPRGRDLIVYIYGKL